MCPDKPIAAAAASPIDHPSVWLVVPTLFLLFGQALAVLPWFANYYWLIFLFLPVVVLFSRNRMRWAVLAIIAGLTFSLGTLRHRQILSPVFPANHLRSIMSEGLPIYLEGSLSQEPEMLSNRNRWLVRSERIWHPTGAEEITGNLLVSVRQTRREWRYGDRVRFRVQPVAPLENGNPRGFDYRSYLARREIYATGFLENDQEIELVARSPGRVWGFVEHLRREIRRFIDRNFPQDTGALMKALVIGDMGGISKSTRAAFTAAGVNHVLSISGLHVGMLGLVVFWLVRLGCSFSAILLLRLNLIKVATSCSFIAVLFYTGLAGGMVPTVRSAIMIGVYELAVLLDREEEVLTSLTFAALLIALYWPGVCADVSFQLSFLAVFFIVLGMRKTQEWFPRQQPKEQLPQERSWFQGKLRKIGLYLAVPVLATIGTGPLIAHYFGHLSLVGFIANPVVVPLVGFVVVPLGLLIAFVALLQPALAVPLVWTAEPLVSGTIRLVGLFSGLPFANVAVPVPNMVEVTALYLIIIAVLLLRRRRHALLAFAIVVLAFIVDGCFWWQQRFGRQDLRVTYLSVGQGDAAVVEFPGSKVLLIDAGGTTTGEFDTGEAIVAPYLRSRKILKVDYLLVSHPRVDHYGGMRTIVREFGPSEFWSGPSRGRTQRFEELEEELESAKIRQVQLTDQDACRAIDQVLLCVLYPSAGATGDVSVVVRLSFGEVSFLFAGDLDKKDEKALVEKSAELSSTVLKVPRHGSHTSSTEEFVTKVSPKLAIISVRERNRFGWPREEVISRYRKAGSEILQTGRDGAVTVETDGKTLRYDTYRSRKRGMLSF